MVSVSVSVCVSVALSVGVLDGLEQPATVGIAATPSAVRSCRRLTAFPPAPLSLVERALQRAAMYPKAS
jgi:hypothetical protein